MPCAVCENAIEREVVGSTTGCSIVMQLSDHISIAHRRLSKQAVAALSGVDFIEGLGGQVYTSIE